jgi:hypothetical protein
MSPADWPLLIAIALVAWTVGMAWRWWRRR